jgi:hypothetical protein
MKVDLSTTQPTGICDQLAGYLPGYDWTGDASHILRHHVRDGNVVMSTNGEQSFPGTVLRLPLRTAELARASKISPKAFTAGDVEELFQKFTSEAPESMLFLRTVETLSLRVWEDGAAQPSEQYCCQIPHNLREPRFVINRFIEQGLRSAGDDQIELSVQQRYLHLLSNLGSAPFSATEYVIPFDITCNPADCRTEKWIVAVRFGTPGQRSTKLAIQSVTDGDPLCKRELKLVPFAQVQLLLPDNYCLAIDSNILQSRLLLN